MNDYSTILSRINTEVNTFKTDLPPSIIPEQNSYTYNSFFTKYIYYIIGSFIIGVIVLLVTTKPFFVMKEEETRG